MQFQDSTTDVSRQFLDRVNRGLRRQAAILRGRVAQWRLSRSIMRELRARGHLDGLLLTGETDWALLPIEAYAYRERQLLLNGRPVPIRFYVGAMVEVAAGAPTDLAAGDEPDRIDFAEDVWLPDPLAGALASLLRRGKIAYETAPACFVLPGWRAGARTRPSPYRPPVSFSDRPPQRVEAILRLVKRVKEARP